MTVTAGQITIAKLHGMQNVEMIARCCNETEARFYIALAMLEKETRTCRNVYGGDSGGALRGFKGTVTKSNYEVFRWMIDVGVPVEQPDGTHKIVKFGPNGVGPSQITHPDLVADMKAKGLEITDMHDNISYGINRIQSFFDAAREDGAFTRAALERAGTRYNGGSAYGASFAVIALEWRNRVGNDDYT